MTTTIISENRNPIDLHVVEAIKVYVNTILYRCYINAVKIPSVIFQCVKPVPKMAKEFRLAALQETSHLNFKKRDFSSVGQSNQTIQLAGFCVSPYMVFDRIFSPPAS